MSRAPARSSRDLAGLVGLPSAGILLLLLACGGDAADPAADGTSASAGQEAPPAGETRSHDGDGGAPHSRDGSSGRAHDGSGEHPHGGAGPHTHAHDGSGAHTHDHADTLAAGVALDPGSGEGWSGSATLLSIGDSVRVLVSVEGSDAGARHRAELLAGSCDDPGPELASLTPVAAGSSGKGSSQTTLPAARLEGHAHGAVRLTAADGSGAACAPVHLAASGHTHG